MDRSVSDIELHIQLGEKLANSFRRQARLQASVHSKKIQRRSTISTMVTPTHSRKIREPFRNGLCRLLKIGRKNAEQNGQRRKGLGFSLVAMG